jgi:hypothetical protein
LVRITSPIPRSTRSGLPRTTFHFCGSNREPTQLRRSPPRKQRERRGHRRDLLWVVNRDDVQRTRAASQRRSPYTRHHRTAERWRSVYRQHEKVGRARRACTRRHECDAARIESAPQSHNRHQLCRDHSGGSDNPLDSGAGSQRADRRTIGRHFGSPRFSTSSELAVVVQCGRFLTRPQFSVVN